MSLKTRAVAGKTSDATALADWRISGYDCPGFANPDWVPSPGAFNFFRIPRDENRYEDWQVACNLSRV